MNALKTKNGIASLVCIFHEDEGGMEALQIVAILAIAAVSLFGVNKIGGMFGGGSGSGSGLLGMATDWLGDALTGSSPDKDGGFFDGLFSWGSES